MTHKFYYKYCKKKGLLKSSSRFQKIDKETIDKLTPLKKTPEVHAGDFVIWDSKLIHQNTYGKRGNGEERIVQYVAFRPDDHKLNTKTQKENRLKYFNDRRTTSHDAIIRVNSEQPQTYGNSELLID